MGVAFAPEVWLVAGPSVTAALGFHYPTRMAVIRLSSGGLFIWSPVALSESLVAFLSDLGPVAHVVAPNSLHDSFLAEWRVVYPEAAFHAAPKLAQARPDVTFASELTDDAHPGWRDEIGQVVIRGNAITTEVVFFHRPSGTVLFTDLLQNLPQGWYSGWRRLIARLDLMIEAEPTVPRKFRIAFRDKPAARVALARVLSWKAQRVVMAHGTPVERDAEAFLARAFRWLRVEGR